MDVVEIKNESHYKCREVVAERDMLRAAMREIYEVWAGSDGFIPETAPEACQQMLIEEMRDIAAKHLV